MKAKDIAKLIVAGAGLAFLWLVTKPKEYVAPPEKVEKAVVFGINEKYLDTSQVPTVWCVQPFVNVTSDFPNEHLPATCTVDLEFNGDKRQLKLNIDSCKLWLFDPVEYKVDKEGTYTLNYTFTLKTAKGVEITKSDSMSKFIPVYKPPTPQTVNITIDSNPRGISINGIYPEFSGLTPVVVKCEKDKTFGFYAPKTANDLVLSDVSNASVVSTDGTVTIKGLADADKTVMLTYTRPAPTAPKYRWSDKVGEIKVYDCWVENGILNVDIECINYGGLNGAMIVGCYKSSGALLGSVGLGRSLFRAEWRSYYESVVIAADLYEWHTSVPVITITDIRVVS